MKKLLQILTAIVVSAGFVGSVASAATCSDVIITNSGNGNNTNVTCTNVIDTTITCVNNIIVGNANLQVADSGSGQVLGNNATGSVTTGTVVNYNGTQTTIGADCGAVVSPSPSVTPSPSPSVTPGAGSVTPVVAVLPFTAGNSAATIVATSLAAAAAVVVVSRLALAAYRRFSVK